MSPVEVLVQSEGESHALQCIVPCFVAPENVTWIRLNQELLDMMFNNICTEDLPASSSGMGSGNGSSGNGMGEASSSGMGSGSGQFDGLEVVGRGRTLNLSSVMYGDEGYYVCRVQRRMQSCISNQSGVVYSKFNNYKVLLKGYFSFMFAII